VQHTGQTGPSQKAPKHQTGLPSYKTTQHQNSSNTGPQRAHPNVHPSKNPTRVAPVRPVRGTGQTGVTWASWDEPHLQVKTPKSKPRSPESLHGLRKTLGIVGTPHGESIDKCMSTKTCQIKRNRKSPAKNSSNPKTPKTPKSSPLTHGFGRGIKGKRTTKGSHTFPPIKSPRARSRKHTKKTIKRGLRKSPPRTTGNNTTKT
jgi:hypothetical protein